ncbi:LOW QUALITY PROTEIN: uncharacterized protein [Narcine bancroftii]|uniref:LOW QUALITY PROTEIN: uncharacterized protein n=1 Tax=Narcine bancroftii TaxID=1343680 RepID=UPI00383199B0
MASKEQVESWTEEVICPVCLDIFTDPVSLECGHNFCRSCITQCCEGEGRSSCPECREEFKGINLRLNRALVRLAEKARNLNLNPEGKELKLNCKEHQEELKLFCETDKKLICLICRDALEHREHRFLPVKEAFDTYKNQAKSSLKELAQLIVKILEVEKEQKLKIFKMKGHSRALLSHISVVFTEIHKRLTEKEQQLIRDLKKQEESIVDKMERNLQEIQQSLNSIQEELAMMQKEVEPKEEAEGDSQQKRRIGKELSSSATGCTLTAEKSNGLPPSTALSEILEELQPAFVTLDVDTVHPELEVSEDRKSVRWTWTWRDLPDTGKRFTGLPCSLGSEGFTSGRHYWEVEVSENRSWCLGVAAESVEREGRGPLTPETGVWSIGQSNEELQANNSPRSRLPAVPIPGRVGVYLSYESGTISFYNANTGSHLHTFTGCEFTGKLYPFFHTREGNWLRICSDPLRICERFRSQDWRPERESVAEGLTYYLPLRAPLHRRAGCRPGERSAERSCHRDSGGDLQSGKRPFWPTNPCCPINLQPQDILEDGRKPEHPDEAHADTGKTHDLLTDSTGFEARWLAGSASWSGFRGASPPTPPGNELLCPPPPFETMSETFTQVLNCSICLDYFVDPVSLECGHNFCHSCVTELWERDERNLCPECKEVFPDRKLRVNRALASLAEKARNLNPSSEQKGGKFQCEEHQEEGVLFCETDKQLICLKCVAAPEHGGHRFMSINEAAQTYKDQMKSSFDVHATLSNPALRGPARFESAAVSTDCLRSNLPRPGLGFEPCLLGACADGGRLDLDSGSGRRPGFEFHAVCEEFVLTSRSVALQRRGAHRAAPQVGKHVIMLRTVGFSIALNLLGTYEPCNTGPMSPCGAINPINLHPPLPSLRHVFERSAWRNPNVDTGRAYKLLMNSEGFEPRSHCANRAALSPILDQSLNMQSNIKDEYGRMHQILMDQEQRLIRGLKKQEKNVLETMDQNVREIQDHLGSVDKKLSKLQQRMYLRNNLTLLKEGTQQRSRAEEKDDRPALVEDGLALERFNGPIQYITWKGMINSLHPAPAPLTLDPKTANPWLIVSKDRTSVRCGDRRQDLPDTPARFDRRAYVLGSEGFTSGRHYWEVEVGDKIWWGLGVAAESANRRGSGDLRPKTGFFTMCLLPGKGYVEFTSPSRGPLNPNMSPKVIGVFLDYEAGQVSFYNASDMSHLHTYTHVFIEKVFPSFSPGRNDAGDNSAPLRIHRVKPH